MNFRSMAVAAGVVVWVAGLGASGAGAREAWQGTWIRCKPDSGKYTITATFMEDRIVTTYREQAKLVARSAMIVRYEKSGNTIKALILKTLKKDGSVRKDYSGIAGQYYVEFEWDGKARGEIRQVAIKSRTKPRRALKTPYVFRRGC